MKKLIVLMAAAVSLASCTTLVAPSGERDVEALAQFVNSGTAVALAGASSAPFLVDQEIVSLKGDVADFWKAVKGSGLRLSATPGSPAVAVTADSYKDFGSAFEVKVFFKKYVAKDARVFTLAASGGKKVLLVARDDLLSRTVFGFKGPF